VFCDFKTSSTSVRKFTVTILISYSLPMANFKKYIFLVCSIFKTVSNFTKIISQVKMSKPIPPQVQIYKHNFFINIKTNTGTLSIHNHRFFFINPATRFGAYSSILRGAMCQTLYKLIKMYKLLSQRSI
jgi:hypothetical protein